MTFTEYFLAIFAVLSSEPSETTITAEIKEGTSEDYFNKAIESYRNLIGNYPDAVYENGNQNYSIASVKEGLDYLKNLP